MPFPVRSSTAWSCSKPAAHACHSRRISPTFPSETKWSARAADRTRLAGLRSCRARVCCPPHIIAAPSSPIYVGHAGFSILGKKYRSVEVDDIAQLSEHERRSHCKTGPDHIADHDLEPQAAR